MKFFTLLTVSSAFLEKSQKVLKEDPPVELEDPLAPPPARGEDPTKLLCTVGERDPAAWCKDWVSCIEQGAAPGNDAESVKKAWAPAQCEEYCGKFPMLTPPEGSNALIQKIFGSNTQKGCMESCENFQNSLSGCVAQIIFDTGSISIMKKDAPLQYNSVVGGCMAQLQAYHTATHTPPGSEPIIPGATGCTVH